MYQLSELKVYQRMNMDVFCAIWQMSEEWFNWC